MRPMAPVLKGLLARGRNTSAGGVIRFLCTALVFVRSVHKKALSVGPGSCVLRRTLLRRSSQNSPSTHSGEWCLKYAVWQTHLLIPLVIMSKRNRASPTARRGGDSSQWDTIARFAGTTPRSRTSSGAKFHEPTSKPLRCWIFDAHYYPFPEWSLVILTSTTTPGGVCVPGK
jgi:hypothetical protein